MKPSLQRSSAGPRFDFTAAMRGLCTEMVARVPEIGHIDLARVAISFSQVRHSGAHGMQAALTPLRFEEGSLTTTRHGRRYTVQRLKDAGGNDYLYILSFYLPRFLDLPLEEKIDTVLHELWHIGPRFDGDLRRFSGRCYAHGPSQKHYDRQVAQLVQRFRSTDPPPGSYEFLTYSFAELRKRFGPVVGTKIRAPKLIPLPDR